ncbi:MAG: ATP-binding protein [Ignavibacteriaceae bacterium]|nr:ATP-binding protein [Ignavibacteriaceae bacterium]
MILSERRYTAFLILDLLIVVLFIPSVLQLSEKARIPFAFSEKNNIITVSSENQWFSAGSEIRDINGTRVFGTESIEVISDFFKSGEYVNITAVESGASVTKPVQLVNFYSAQYILIQLITALIFIVIGNLVLLRGKDKKAAAVFHFTTSGTAVILVMTWGANSIDSAGWIGFLLRTLFHASYIFVPIAFIHFALIYPLDRSDKLRIVIRLLYSAAFILFFYITYSYYLLDTLKNEATVKSYIGVFNHLRILIACSVAASIATFLVSYKKTHSLTERKKLLWLLLGFFIGPVFFVLFWVLPQALTGNGLLPEEVISLLMLSVPVTFSISIIRYHWLDINLIIKRSISYSIVITLLAGLYLGAIAAISHYAGKTGITAGSTISAIFLAFLFQPVSKRVKDIVDKKFFRVNYDFRQTVKDFGTELELSGSTYAVFNTLGSRLSEILPAEFMLIFETEGDQIRIIRESGELPDIIFTSSAIYYLKNMQAKIAVDPDEFDKGGDAAVLSESLTESGVALVIKNITNVQGLAYVILMGKKKSGFAFSMADCDLLVTLTATAVSEAEKILLHQSLIRKEMETERLLELDQQKSLFVSSVSHDLKTPLTSINLVAQQMKRNKSITREKTEGYLDIILGESERLTRLINNVLDYSKIERGIKEYSMEPVVINRDIEAVMRLMEYQFSLSKFRVEYSLPDEEIEVIADSDAIREAVINLLNNAMKFSKMKKETGLKLYKEDGYAVIEVSDSGIGMSSEETENLFTPYYRAKSAQKSGIPGTGLGLSIVKHIVDSHKGFIAVKSTPGAGTTFTIKLPVSNEKDFNNRG